MDAAASRWNGTPYMAGACCPGPTGGVDCVRFVNAMLAEAYGVDPANVPDAAQDAAYHNARPVRVAVRALRRHYPAARIDSQGPLAPWDILVVGTSRPAHLAIVADDGAGIWHTDRPCGLVRSSVQAVSVAGLRVIAAYRPALPDDKLTT